MKIKNVIELFAIYKQLEGLQLPLQLSYKLNLLINSYQSTWDFYDSEMKKIRDTYGERDENNNLIVIDDNSIKINPSAAIQVSDLINTLNNLDAPMTNITFELDELTPLNLTPKDLMALMPFIIEKPQV